jgi:hypothetical protein
MSISEWPADQVIAGGGWRRGSGLFEIRAIQVLPSGGSSGGRAPMVGEGYSKGLMELRSVAGWLMPKRSASQSAINSCPIVGLSC